MQFNNSSINIMQNIEEKNNISDDLFTIMSDTQGTHFALILPSCIMTLLSIIGIPLNFGIIYVSIKYRNKLNSTANFLIALNALFDLLQLTHPFPYLYIAITSKNFIGTFDSMRLLIPSLFGIQCSLTCITLTAFDRLFAVLYPIKYNNMSTKKQSIYSLILIILCTVNGLWNVIELWKKCELESEKQVTGFIGQIGWDSRNYLGHYLVGPILIGISIFCYILICLILIVRKAIYDKNNTLPLNNNLFQHQYKLLKSLSLIVTVHVGTVLFGSLLLGVTSNFSTIVNWYLMNLSVSIILMGPLTNAIVLYLNSSDYFDLFTIVLHQLKIFFLKSIVSILKICRIFPQINLNITQPTKINPQQNQEMYCYTTTEPINGINNESKRSNKENRKI